MKSKTGLPLLLALVFLAGCAQHYVVKLGGGREVTTVGKPKLKGGAYVCKDDHGRQFTIPSSRVREIAPASVAAEDKKQFAPPKPTKPKHWYFLWLA